MRKMIKVEVPPEPAVDSVVLTGEKGTIHRKAWLRTGEWWRPTVLNEFSLNTARSWTSLMVEFGEVELVHDGSADE